MMFKFHVCAYIAVDKQPHFMIQIKKILCFSSSTDLEWYMVSHKIITDSELEEDPRSAGSERKQVHRAGTFSNHMAADSDDDFDN